MRNWLQILLIFYIFSACDFNINNIFPHEDPNYFECGDKDSIQYVFECFAYDDEEDDYVPIMHYAENAEQFKNDFDCIDEAFQNFTFPPYEASVECEKPNYAKDECDCPRECSAFKTFEFTKCNSIAPYFQNFSAYNTWIKMEGPSTTQKVGANGGSYEPRIDGFAEPVYHPVQVYKVYDYIMVIYNKYSAIDYYIHPTQKTNPAAQAALISQNNNNFWRGQDWLYQLLKEEDTGWVELFEKAGWKPIVVP